MCRPKNQCYFHRRSSTCVESPWLGPFFVFLQLSLKPCNNSTVPEVLLSTDGQCPQLVSDHLRLWRAYSDLLTGVSQRDSLVTHFRCLIRLIQTVGGALDGLGGEANIRLVAYYLEGLFVVVM